MSTAQRFQPTAPTTAAAVPTVGSGLIGYDFMGRAHSTAYQALQSAFWPPPALPRLVALCGRSAARVAGAAERFGFEGYYTDWPDLIADERLTFVDNCAWHDAHAKPCIAAARAGKRVLCKKPLALIADEATASGVTHRVAFNCRFASAVRLAPGVQPSKKAVEQRW